MLFKILSSLELERWLSGYVCLLFLVPSTHIVVHNFSSRESDALPSLQSPQAGSYTYTGRFCALCIQMLISVPWDTVTVRTQALLWVLKNLLYKCGIKNAPQLSLVNNRMTSQWLGSIERKAGLLILAKDPREKSQVEGDTDTGWGPREKGHKVEERKHGRHEESLPREFSIITHGYSRGSQGETECK